jgi:hypothetical protein
MIADRPKCGRRYSDRPRTEWVKRDLDLKIKPSSTRSRVHVLDHAFMMDQRLASGRGRPVLIDTLTEWHESGEVAQGAFGSATPTRLRPRRHSCASGPPGSAPGFSGTWGTRVRLGMACGTSRSDAVANGPSIGLQGTNEPLRFSRASASDSRSAIRSRANWHTLLAALVRNRVHLPAFSFAAPGTLLPGKSTNMPSFRRGRGNATQWALPAPWSDDWGRGTKESIFWMA